MRTFFAVALTVILSYILWIIAGFGIKVIMLAWPDAILFQDFDRYFKQFIETLLSPGIASFFSLKIISQNFSQVKIDTIFTAFSSVVVAIFLIMAILHLTTSPNIDIWYFLKLVVVPISFVVGAKVFTDE